MPLFVRKNIVTFTVTFAASDGTATQPSAASAMLSYKDLAGSQHNASIPLVYSSATNTWSGTWDSSAAGEGTVEWMIYGYGTLQAADQGSFAISANAANTV